MARYGRTQPQKGIVQGYPPTTFPLPAPATAPVAGGLTLTGGGRHGRGTPSKPFTMYAPRPLVGIGITYNDGSTATLLLRASAAESQSFADIVTATFALSAATTESASYADTSTVRMLLTAAVLESWVVVVPPEPLPATPYVAGLHWGSSRLPPV